MLRSYIVKTGLCASVFALLAFVPNLSKASTATGTFAVTAAVSSTCSVAGGSLSFPAYVSGQSEAATGTGTISVSCSNGASYTIGLDQGTGTGHSATARVLMNGSNVLNYELYTEVALTNIWDTSTHVYSGTGNGATQSVSVYGQISASQSVVAGSYSDSVTVTVTY